jgi:hypothetical protein
VVLNYVRLNLVVEGPTEETFVRDILVPTAAPNGLHIKARSVQTASHRRSVFRGGMTNYGKAKRDIQRWLAEDKTAYVTTMFDLYRLPGDFPGSTKAKSHKNAFTKVKEIERALAADLDNPRFIPYIQLHEFEGLLFSDVNVIDSTLTVFDATSQLSRLVQIRSEFGSPEEIDDGEETAPSRRLHTLYPTVYDKVVFGSLIAESIGLAKIRAECRHFDAWLAHLEALPPLQEIS